MNAHVVTLESAAHARVEMLLPWYATATLPAAERAEVEAHLPRCTRCRSDLAFQTRLLGERDTPGVADDMALGWEALRHRLDAQAIGASSRRPARRWVGWPLAWGIQCAASLALLLIAVSPHLEPYRTLGAAGNGSTADALVVFKPDATETQMRAALRAADARLVGGPTTMDAYLLQMPDGGASALERLRGQPGVAQVVSLAAGTPP